MKTGHKVLVFVVAFCLIVAATGANVWGESVWGASALEANVSKNGLSGAPVSDPVMELMTRTDVTPTPVTPTPRVVAVPPKLDEPVLATLSPESPLVPVRPHKYNDAAFRDIQSGDDYTRQLRLLYDSFVVNGSEDGKFYPKNSATVQQFLVMLSRACDRIGSLEGDTSVHTMVYDVEGIELLYRLAQADKRNVLTEALDKLSEPLTIEIFCDVTGALMNLTDTMTEYCQEHFRPGAKLTRIELIGLLSEYINLEFPRLIYYDITVRGNRINYAVSNAMAALIDAGYRNGWELRNVGPVFYYGTNTRNPYKITVKFPGLMSVKFGRGDEALYVWWTWMYELQVWREGENEPTKMDYREIVELFA